MLLSPHCMQLIYTHTVFSAERRDVPDDEPSTNSTSCQIEAMRGRDGRDGRDGVMGEKGERGEQGVVGPQGEKGESGPRGAVGINGDSGDKGDRGLPGPRGPCSHTGGMYTHWGRNNCSSVHGTELVYSGIAGI